MPRDRRTADFDGKDIMLWVCQDGIHTREFYRTTIQQRAELMNLVGGPHIVARILELYARGELGEPYEVRPGAEGGW